jgi:candicidin polyketide synthase FscB
LDLWPPARAVPLPLDGHYERLAELGYGYGPAFQGLEAMWRRGEEVFAEVGLPDEVREQAGSFGLHPVLLETALHAWGAWDPVARLPFSWNGVRLHTRGASLLRVRLSPAVGGSVSVQVADGTGQPVAAVGRWSASRTAQEWLLGLGS